MKKILFVDQCLGTGGAERVMCTVLRGLPADKFEIHLLLISYEGPLRHLIPNHVKIHVLDVSNTRRALSPFLKAIWSIRPDVVYVTSSRTAALVLLARFFCPCYKVVARYSSMPARDVETKTLSGWRLWLTRTLYRRADFVIAQTAEMAGELMRVFGVPSAKLQQIDNPIDERYILESVKGCSKPFREDAINVLAVGTIYPVKGFDVLINAMARARQHDRRFQLHILGSDFDNNKEKLTHLAMQLNIADAVSFHGFQANPYPYYKHCDLFVLSSRQEAMPNVLLECLYFGKPVIATRCVPVIERLVKDGVNGFQVEIENVEQMAEAILKYETLRPVHNNSISDNGIVNLLISVSSDECCQM